MLTPKNGQAAQTIRRQQLANWLIVFDHFVELGQKEGLRIFQKEVMRILGFAPLNDHFNLVFPKKLFNYSFCEKFQPSNFEIEMTFEIRKI